MTTKNFIKNSLVLVLMGASSVTFAQNRKMQKSPETRAQHQADWMKQNLGLTDDQDKKVYDIILSTARQVDKTRMAPASANKRAELHNLNQNKDAAIKGVLTGDQYQKYEQHVQDMQQKHKAGAAAMQNNGQH